MVLYRGSKAHLRRSKLNIMSKLVHTASTRASLLIAGADITNAVRVKGVPGRVDRWFLWGPYYPGNVRADY